MGSSVNGAVPVFVTISVCAWLVVLTTCAPNISNEGVMARPMLTPCPNAVMICVPAVSVMVTMPLSVPVVVGSKTTLRLQLAPAAIEPGQFVVSEKLAVGTTEVMVTADDPELVKMTVCA